MSIITKHNKYKRKYKINCDKMNKINKKKTKATMKKIRISK